MARRSTRRGWATSTSSAADAAATAGGGSAVEKMNGPGAVDEELGQLGRPADVGAVAAEGLAERADQDVHLVLEAGRGDRAAPAGSQAAGPVGLVDHEPAAVAARQLGELRQGRDVAVHREDAVGDDHRGAPARAAQAPLEVLDVGVAVDEGVGLRQAAAVDDARVVQLVGGDQLALAGERRDRPRVRQVAGAEEEGGGPALELGEAGARARRAASSSPRSAARLRRSHPIRGPRPRRSGERPGDRRARGSCWSRGAAPGGRRAPPPGPAHPRRR